MSRPPNHPPKPARLEATPLGLTLVIDEPIKTEAARQFLADLDRQVAALKVAAVAESEK